VCGWCGNAESLGLEGEWRALSVVVCGGMFGGGVGVTVV